MLRERSKAQKYVQYNSIYIKFKNFMRDKKIKKKKSAINIKKSRWCMEGKRRLVWGTHAGALALTEVVFFMSWWSLYRRLFYNFSLSCAFIFYALSHVWEIFTRDKRFKKPSSVKLEWIIRVFMKNHRRNYSQDQE